MLRGALVLALVGACVEREPSPPSSDAGRIPEINACCWRWFGGGEDAVKACIRDHIVERECRWLSCFGGLRVYTACPED